MSEWVFELLIAGCLGSSVALLWPTGWLRLAIALLCLAWYLFVAVLFARVCRADRQEEPAVIFVDPDSDLASDLHSCLSRQDACKTSKGVARVYNDLNCPKWSRCFR